MFTVLATLSELHIVLALIIVFLLFGGKKLPELARGIGEAMKEFKKAQRDIQIDEQRPISNVTPVQQPAEPAQIASTTTKPSDPKLN